MEVADVLVDAFGRTNEVVAEVLAGLDDDQLTWRADADANSIAWLVWHLTRIEDDHLAGAFGGDQVWIADGWVERFGLPFDPRAHGYGHTSRDVAAVRAPGVLLGGYQDAVHARALDLLRGVTDDGLERVVDTRWDPPVTLGVRLVSVITDCLQHAGQASFVRGLIERR